MHCSSAAQTWLPQWHSPSDWQISGETHVAPPQAEPQQRRQAQPPLSAQRCWGAHAPLSILASQSSSRPLQTSGLPPPNATHMPHFWPSASHVLVPVQAPTPQLVLLPGRQTTGMQWSTTQAWFVGQGVAGDHDAQPLKTWHCLSVSWLAQVVLPNRHADPQRSGETSAGCDRSNNGDASEGSTSEGPR